MSKHERPNIAASIRQAWIEHLRAGRGGYTPRPRNYVWATGRRDCTRWMALDLIHPENRETFDDDTLERFANGNEIEALINARLTNIGLGYGGMEWSIEGGQQPFEIKDRDGTLLIVGKVDGFIVLREKLAGIRRIVYEIKTGVSFQRVVTPDDLDRSPWTRHAKLQLLSYLYANGLPLGIMVIRKPGLPTLVEFWLEDHLEEVEAFLVASRQAVDAANAGSAERIPFCDDTTICLRCPHLAKSCAPPKLTLGSGANLISDEQWESELREINETNHAARRNKTLRKMTNHRVAKMLNDEPGMVLVGDTLIQAQQIERKEYTVKAGKYLRIDIREHGSASEG